MKYFLSVLLYSMFLILGATTKLVGDEDYGDAYLLGDVVKIPVLSVGLSQYRLDLQLIPNSNPVQLKLIVAEDITSSAPDISRASTFINNILTIPVLTAGSSSTSYKIELLLVATEPSVILQLNKADVNAWIDTRSNKERAAVVYSESISTNIVQSKCVVCHVVGGIADGTSLKLQRTSNTSESENMVALEALVKSRADGKDYILGKVSGNDHGGGVQLSAGSSDYNKLSKFLSLIAEEAITFSNVKSRLQDIPRIAWQDTQHLLATNNAVSPSSLVELEVPKGPTTELYFEDNQTAFENGIKLWANFKQPKKYLALLYDFADKSWAVSQYDASALGFSQILVDGATLINLPCTPTICTGANSGIMTSDGLGVGVFGISANDSWDSYRYGAIQIHEYSHAAQCAPWIGKDAPCNHQQDMSPCWLIEGQAHFLGISASHSNVEDYKATRNSQVNAHRVESFSNFSTEKILQYYDDDIPRQCIGKPNYKLGYTLGMLTVEILSAIGGTESSMKILDLGGAGQSFEEAFINVYGISWEDAKPVLADIVADLHKEVYK